MSLSPEVRAGWCAFTELYEGKIPWPYLDVKGLVTVGLGCLVDPLPRALDAGVPEGVWDTVKAMPAGLLPGHYRCGWQMTDAQIEALAVRRLDSDLPYLEHVFGDLSALPVEVQFAICSVDWACGAGWPGEFPHATSAILAENYACPACVSCATKAEFEAHRKGCASAAAQLRIREAGNPGVVPRNARNVNLLRRAAGATADLV